MACANRGGQAHFGVTPPTLWIFFKTLLGASPPPRGHPLVAMMCQKVIDENKIRENYSDPFLELFKIFKTSVSLLSIL